MNNTPTQQANPAEAVREKKPGFFGRLFQKLDSSMKQKADEKSKQGSCCGGSDSKGGKCC